MKKVLILFLLKFTIFNSHSLGFDINKMAKEILPIEDEFKLREIICREGPEQAELIKLKVLPKELCFIMTKNQFGKKKYYLEKSLKSKVINSLQDALKLGDIEYDIYKTEFGNIYIFYQPGKKQLAKNIKESLEYFRKNQIFIEWWKYFVKITRIIILRNDDAFSEDYLMRADYKGVTIYSSENRWKGEQSRFSLLLQLVHEASHLRGYDHSNIFFVETEFFQDLKVPYKMVFINDRYDGRCPIVESANYAEEAKFGRFNFFHPE